MVYFFNKRHDIFSIYHTTIVTIKILNKKKQYEIEFILHCKLKRFSMSPKTQNRSGKQERSAGIS